MGLWKRLSGLSTKELITATTLVISEHVEKTAATITLRTIHAQHQNVIDEAIREALKHRKPTQLQGTNADESLTPQDFFYREISRVEEIINGFHLISERATNGSWAPREVISGKQFDEIPFWIVSNYRHKNERHLFCY